MCVGVSVLSDYGRRHVAEREVAAAPGAQAPGWRARHGPGMALQRGFAPVFSSWGSLKLLGKLKTCTARSGDSGSGEIRRVAVAPFSFLGFEFEHFSFVRKLQIGTEAHGLPCPPGPGICTQRISISWPGEAAFY